MMNLEYPKVEGMIELDGKATVCIEWAFDEIANLTCAEAMSLGVSALWTAACLLNEAAILKTLHASDNASEEMAARFIADVRKTREAMEDPVFVDNS